MWIARSVGPKAPSAADQAAADASLRGDEVAAQQERDAALVHEDGSYDFDGLMRRD